MDDAIRLPGLGPVIGGQVRYQLTLMLRTPRTLLAGLILPGALLALQLGRVQHLGQGAAAGVLAARVAGLVVLGAMSVAYMSHASSLVVAREDGVLCWPPGRWAACWCRCVASGGIRTGHGTHGRPRRETRPVRDK